MANSIFFSSSKRPTHGFAAFELIVIFAAVAMATFLVGGLVQQVLKMGKRSSQTGAILELRSRANAITKNSDTWLSKMRASHSIYASCIPDASSATFSSHVFNCPDVSLSQSLKDQDPFLSKVAGPKLHIASAPIVDIMGDGIAGTEEKPLYLDLSGRLCEGGSASTTCPLKSTGFFMRTNDSTTGDPGELRFVIKIEKNLASMGKENVGVIKPEYMSIEIGRSWTIATKNPFGDEASKLGYLLDGSELYVKTGLSCSGANQVLTGIDAEGNASCKSFPQSCAPGQEAILNSQNSELQCSSTNNCGENQVFLGYFAGTGTPVCTAANLSCAKNEVQVGVKKQGSNIVADCKALPSCSDSKVISYDGSQFQCVADILAQSCPDGKAMSGVNADGSLKCESVNRNLAATKALNASVAYDVAGNYTWTVPADVTRIKIRLVGGGGGGAGVVNAGGRSGGGGGAGGYCEGYFDVTPNSTLAIVVGKGGEGKVQDGETGGTSTVQANGTLLCGGTGGGGGAVVQNVAGGGPGVGTGLGNIKITGGYGEDGKEDGHKTSGHGGASYFGGGGRAGTFMGMPAIAAGSGGGASYANQNGKGGSGAPGLVIIEY